MRAFERYEQTMQRWETLLVVHSYIFHTSGLKNTTYGGISVWRGRTQGPDGARRRDMAQKIGGPAGPPPLSDAREHELRQKFYAFDRDKDGSALTLSRSGIQCRAPGRTSREGQHRSRWRIHPFRRTCALRSDWSRDPGAPKRR